MKEPCPLPPARCTIQKNKIMKKSTHRGNINLSWILRILLILTIILWAIFPGDIFEESFKFWEKVEARLLHNIPTFVMIIILIIGWKWENIGGILLILGVIGFGTSLFVMSTSYTWGTIILLVIPFFIGALFLINYYLLGYKLPGNETTAT